MTDARSVTINGLRRVLMSQSRIAFLFAMSLLAFYLVCNDSMNAQECDTTEYCDGYPDMVSSDGGCCTSQYLLGDWGGTRSSLADNGITLDASVTQYYQGVTSGGRRREFEYAGHGEYILTTDFGKLGVHDGLLMKVRAEHRFGTPINQAAGVLLSPAMLSTFPVPNEEDLIISEFLFTQFLSENVAIYAGKMMTVQSGLTPFTAGRGDDTFMNSSFIFPVTTTFSAPYSTLGAGFSIFLEEFPVLSFNILNSSDTTTQSGFDQLFEDGVALTGAFSLPTPLGGKSGAQTLGFTWNNRTQVALGQDPRVVLPGFPPQQVNEAWSLFWSGFQYIETYDDPSKGWGVFAAAGISDGNPTLTRSWMHAGIGGNIRSEHRPNDRFGVGWFYNELSDETGPILDLLAAPRDSWGVELFYNFAVSPSIYITPDLQVLQPGNRRDDTALLFGVRAHIEL